jgi:hypothetical protein
MSNLKNRMTALAAMLALALLAVPATAAADQYEPNDSPLQAWGPIMANTTYVTTRDTINDQDWFVFYVPYHEQVTIALTDSGGDLGTYVYLVGADGNTVDSAEIAPTRQLADTLDQGAYYLQFKWYGGHVGDQVGFRVTTNGALVDQATLAGIIAKQQNETAAIAARAKDEGQIAYYSGQVNYWNGQVNYWTPRVQQLTAQASHWSGQVRYWQTQVKHDTTALKRADRRAAITLATRRLNAAKRQLANAQAQFKRINGALTNANAALKTATTNLGANQSSLAYWQACWNTDNANVNLYA